MEYIQLLKRKTICILWLSQLLSAIGDQVYLVCASWLAAQTSVYALALVAGSEYVSAFIFSFWAGVLADRMDKKKLMVFADLGRAVAVLTLPVAGIFGQISTWHLVLVGLTLGSLGALFDPCLMATIPKLIDDKALLRATNGLMDFTKRLSRVLGPAIAGLLATFVPLHSLFSLNALSFFISAAGVIYMAYQIRTSTEKKVMPPLGKYGHWKEIGTAIRLIKAHDLIAWELVAFFFLNVLYAIAYMTGLPLMAKQKFGDNIGAYGFLVSTYGFVSVVANLIMGNRKVNNEPLTIFLGYTMWGSGFFCLALAPNLVLGALGLAIGALASPMAAICLMTIIQREIPYEDLGKIYSLRNTITYAGLGLGLILSSYLYSHWSVVLVTMVAAVGFFLVGIFGMLRFFHYPRVSL